MAQQVKIRKDEISDQSEISENGTHTIDPSLIMPALYPMSKFIGSHKDDPYVAEVWDRIIASRHSDRLEESKEE
jgi:hypothetical protein